MEEKKYILTFILFSDDMEEVSYQESIEYETFEEAINAAAKYPIDKFGKVVSKDIGKNYIHNVVRSTLNGVDFDQHAYLFITEVTNKKEEEIKPAKESKIEYYLERIQTVDGKTASHTCIKLRDYYIKDDVKYAVRDRWIDEITIINSINQLEITNASFANDKDAIIEYVDFSKYGYPIIHVTYHVFVAIDGVMDETHLKGIQSGEIILADNFKLGVHDNDIKDNTPKKKLVAKVRRKKKKVNITEATAFTTAPTEPPKYIVQKLELINNKTSSDTRFVFDEGTTLSRVKEFVRINAETIIEAINTSRTMSMLQTVYNNGNYDIKFSENCMTQVDSSIKIIRLKIFTDESQIRGERGVTPTFVKAK